MKFEEVYEHVGRVPFISRANAKFLYDTVLENDREAVLELGIAHGTASCIIAAALDERKAGRLTAVDLLDRKDFFKPSAEEQLARCGLSSYVDIVRMKTGYSWYLHDKIAEQTREGVCQEAFDLCIIDGPKNWTIDGHAFFCADKLLRHGGEIIFDDYSWTYEEAAKTRSVVDGISIREMSEDEVRTPHIREVVELLVRQHPSYGSIRYLDDRNWVIARKTASTVKIIDFVERRSRRAPTRGLARVIKRKLLR